MKLFKAVMLVGLLGLVLTFAGPEIGMMFGSPHTFGLIVLAAIGLWAAWPKPTPKRKVRRHRRTA